jgi:DNA-binding transcriptional LysR family regulator
MTYIEERKLHHFIAAVETGSVLSAAERVHLSQPALSRSIRGLEASVGVPLLERHPRGVRPTVYGEVLLRHALLLRSQVRLALSEIDALREGREGHLRIGVAPSFQRILPAAVARLLTIRPQLTFDFFEGTYDVVAKQLLAGDLEAAFTLFPAGEPEEGLVLQPLLASEFRVVMGASHAFARRRRARLRDLAAVPWVMVSRPWSLLVGVREIFHRAGVMPPAKCVETDSVPIVKELLRSGGFVALLPREIVEEEVQAGELTAKRLPEVPGSGIAGMITREGAVLPAALDALVVAVENERDRRHLPAPLPPGAPSSSPTRR